MIEMLGKVAGSLAEKRLVRVLNSAFVRLVPFIVIGAVILAVLNLPIPWFHQLVRQGLGEGFHRFLAILSDSTFSIITLAALCSISLAYANEYSSTWKSGPYMFVPMFTAVACFVILFVWQDGSLNFRDIGTNGIFKAIFVSLTAHKLLFWLNRLADSRFSRYRGYNANLAVQSAFSSVVPVACTLTAFVALRTAGDALLAATDVEGLMLQFIYESEADNIFTVGLMVLASQLLAFIGAHNFVLFDFIPAIEQLPTITTIPVIFSVRSYYQQFALVGGSGATLGLLIALALFNRDWYKGRQMAKASFFPLTFNINEPLLYGFPVILNPFYLIPFVTAPLASAVISYLAFYLKLVPPITMAVSWTTPPLLSGYLSTGSLTASVLQAVCVVVSVLLYYPFVRAHRSYEQDQRKHRFLQMEAALDAAANGLAPPVISRDDPIGELAREFSSYFIQAAKEDRLPFFLAYQPKTDRHGQVVGSEALLRYSDDEMGKVSPITVVELMGENGLSVALGRWVIETAIREFAQIRTSHLTNLRMSINLDPKHLAEDQDLTGFLSELRDRYVVLPGEIELEITEHVAIQAGEATRQVFSELRDLGFGLAIDDLGMGYSSLNYISEYGVSTVKIDTSLVKEIVVDHKQRRIVSSVVSLSRQLGLELVVEGVETSEQVEALSALGVEAFQGFFFSKPLPLAEFAEYYARNH